MKAMMSAALFLKRSSAPSRASAICSAASIRLSFDSLSPRPSPTSSAVVKV
jgi:hypothetical protein